MTLTGWPADTTSMEEELRPFARRKYELSVEEGCVLWGSRVIVPSKGRSQILQMLHEAHPGIARMKSLARGYVWWPGIDQELEHCVKSCQQCQVNQKLPPVSPLHPWSWPNKPWSRVHIDYAGPFFGKMFLLLIDAHSKWLEIHMTTASTSAATISLMRRSFASLGLPEVIVSDNAANFTSDEFEQFLKKNGVKHVRTPPYHPSSNGLAERAVQTFKEGMRKMTDGSLETKLSRFLFKYRMTPQSTTGVSPAELIFGRRLRSHLDNIRPDIDRKTRLNQERQKQGHDRRARVREFRLNDLVYAKSYGSGASWLPGKITAVHGAMLFTVQLENGRIVRKHTDQLRSRINSNQETNSGEVSEDLDFPTSSNAAVREHTTEPDGDDTLNQTLPPEDENLSESNSAREPAASETNRSTIEQDKNKSTTNVEQTDRESNLLPRRSGRVRHPPNRFEPNN